eukprot:3401374-Pyramimonas_sp.AAC.1
MTALEILGGVDVLDAALDEHAEKLLAKEEEKEELEVVLTSTITKEADLVKRAQSPGEEKYN